MIKFLQKLFEPAQTDTPAIWCKMCRNNMYLDNSFVSDTYDENGHNHVKYECEVCGTKADFNFDIAPVPINWETLNA